MHPVAHGIDIIEVARVARVLERHGAHFLDRVFTPHEQILSDGRRRAAEHLAVRFAAKEAAFKALGTGLSGGVSWTEVEVYRVPGGPPSLRVSGRAGEIARERGIGGWLVSLSHTEAYATASVIALGARADGAGS